MSFRASNRARGAVRNIANQLVQIAVGWEASIDGPLFDREPRTGSYSMDLVRNVSAVNGRETDLGMKTVLAKWLEAELERLGQDRYWITTAKVDVAYQLIPSHVFVASNPGWWTTQAFIAQLSATASVATESGSAEASYKNAQALSGRIAEPPLPLPEQYRRPH